MSNRWWIILPLFAVLCMTFACTEADLCEDESHTGHGSVVRMGFVWPKDSTPPDSMFIVAVRVINHRKFGMVVATDNLRGHYFYNAPLGVEPWVDPDAPEPEPEPEPDPNVIAIEGDPSKDYNGGIDPTSTTPSPSGEEEEAPQAPVETVQVDRFSLPAGTYSFLTMNTDSITAVYRNVIDYLDAEGTGMQYGEVGMEYRTYKLGDEKIIIPGKNYQDYNQGFEYILTESPPIYMDHQTLIEIEQNSEQNVQFQPQMLTQNVDIYFDIEKDFSDGDPFVVDSVIAEVSGIPVKASLFTGHLNLNRTCKMLFRTQLEDANGNPLVDTPTNSAVRVHGNINVLSILRSEKPTNTSGPGILQVAFYTHTEVVDEAGKVQKGPARRMQSHVNMYNALTEANLITYSDDYQYATKSSEHAVVNIDVKAVIKAANASGSGNSGQGGINDWYIDNQNDVNNDVEDEPIEI